MTHKTCTSYLAPKSENSPAVVAIVAVLVVLVLVLVLVHLIIVVFIGIVGVVLGEAQRCANDRVKVRRDLLGAAENERFKCLYTRPSISDTLFSSRRPVPGTGTDAQGNAANFQQTFPRALKPCGIVGTGSGGLS